MTMVKFYNYSTKFSNRVENTVGKRETACYEQFILFKQCFQKICTPDVKTIASLGKGQPFTPKILILMHQ